MKLQNILLTISTLFLLFCLLCFPQALLQKSIESVDLWFNTVLPSLFPFLTATGILIRLGIAHKLGYIFQPIMKPIFGLSGICAFPLILGMISGYPSGAKITVTLCQNKALSQKEAQAILAFCNNPGPLFVVGTAGTAFLKNPAMGYFMLFCIFAGAITTGILLRFFYKTENNITAKSNYTLSAPSNIEPIGKILANSVADAMETVTQIGGFIILFGVIIEAFQQTGIIAFFAKYFSGIFSLSSSAIAAILGGILEMTNGAFLLSQSPEQIHTQLTAITAILSFGGLSILAQTLGILSSIPISSAKYFFSKCLNSIFSAIICFFCYPLFQNKLIKAVSVSSFATKTASFYHHSFVFYFSFLLFALLLLSFYHLRQN